MVKKGQSKKTSNTKVKTNKKLPTIAILHTGGTIASKVDYKTGGATSAFSPEEIVSLFPELLNMANIESELIAQMWSDDLRFEHFSLIAKSIEKFVKKGVDGILIGMGTDNLAVASAALAFIVESSPIPIVFVGAQRSSDRGSSDAAMNVICATKFVLEANFGGVAICMHSTSSDNSCAILPACKTYKLHTSRRDAFQVVNDSIIALIDYKTKKITWKKKDYSRKSKKLVIHPKMEDKVGFLKSSYPYATRTIFILQRI